MKTKIFIVNVTRVSIITQSFGADINGDDFFIGHDSDADAADDDDDDDNHSGQHIPPNFTHPGTTLANIGQLIHIVSRIHIFFAFLPMPIISKI